MNKKFCILGVVLMALFGLISCNQTIGSGPDDGFGWNDYKDRGIEEKYRGTWRSVNSHKYDSTLFESIIFYENYFVHSKEQDGNSMGSEIIGGDEEDFILYTEGADLYKRHPNNYGSQLIGTFTSDTTFQIKIHFSGWEEVNYYKE
jgi:hypothetical protein